MDFKARAPLGKTGLRLSRIGLASGYGVPAAAIEKAFHEYGVNYLHVSPILNLKIAGFGGFRLERYVDKWLTKLNLEWADLLFQDVRKPVSRRFTDRIQRLRDSGKVRFVGISSHERPLLPRIARGEANAPADFFHVRYNAVHTGAEKDVFPHLPQEDRPGIVIFTATCWRKLLKPKLMPAGERPLTAAECYRFVLSHPDVDVCITGPGTEEQMEANLGTLDAGPLDEEEMARVRRIGEHIYGKK
ncbi:MAG: aldo/keto reductase [Planctomycetota bacterium]|jgi:aryl-alcohol dehydrogenase-like predicted oxidoreductase